MVFLAILIAWLVVSIAVLALCMIAHMGDLQLLEHADLERSECSDGEGIPPPVGLTGDTFAWEVLYDASEIQAA
jgi:hypothetical protein